MVRILQRSVMLFCELDANAYMRRRSQAQHLEGLSLCDCSIIFGLAMLSL
jgi:hypothetical protein